MDKQIKQATNQELLKKLVYIGCDGYYLDAWKSVIKELSRRLDVDEKELNI